MEFNGFFDFLIFGPDGSFGLNKPNYDRRLKENAVPDPCVQRCHIKQFKLRSSVFNKSFKRRLLHDQEKFVQ